MAEVEAPLARVPVFVRAGAVLPVRLAPSLAWGESMTAGHEAAVVVAAPQPAGGVSGETVSCEAGRIVLTAVSGGMRCTVDGHSDVRYLILYGTAPDLPMAVCVDGHAIPKLTDSEWVARPVGGVAEAGRSVVRLPDGLRRHVEIARA